MKYVGVCYDSGAWGGDLTGLLVFELPEGWRVETHHISSSVSWSERDIRRRYDLRECRAEGDSFEWLGLLTLPEIEARFGWAKADS